MRKLDAVRIATCFLKFLLAYLNMSKFSSDSQLAVRVEQIASAAARKQARNDQAAEREHIRLTRKVAHEFDDAFGSGGILKRGLARINNNSLAAPAERKRDLLVSTFGRSFHGKGATYSKNCKTTDGKGRKRSASSGAAHYRYIEDSDHEAARAAASTGSHVAYIDGSRVEASDEGDRLSASNIEGSFVERMQFFALAEAFERESHGDKATLDLNRASDKRAAALADPACDPAIRALIERYPLPHNGGTIKISLEGSNKQLRALLMAHGFKLSTAPKNDARMAQDGIIFHSGRSGRTHFRWVFELPKEFTARQRKQVLKRLCAYMDEKNCMYAAVIHAPDPHNCEDNHHLHLIFYDRKCRRLTGTDADLVNVSEPFKEDIRDEIAAGQIKAGEWDFTAERHYKSNRSWKIHYPFRAEKSRDVTKGKDFKKRFRQEFAEIVNGVSAKTGGPTIYDPRSYTDRNVDISPSKHLGQLHASEIAGIPTLIGLSNERNQADDARRSIFARHKEEQARLSALDLQLAPFHPGQAHPHVSGSAATRLQNLADARLATDANLALGLWLLETARERSRAVLVRDRQRRAAQKGPPREQREREMLADAAEAHLAQLDAQDAKMLRVVADVQRQIELAPIVTEESVERTALNCEFLQKLYPAVADRTAIDNSADVLVAEPIERNVSTIDRMTIATDLRPVAVERSSGFAEAQTSPVAAANSLTAHLNDGSSPHSKASTIDRENLPAPSDSHVDQAQPAANAVSSDLNINPVVTLNDALPAPTAGTVDAAARKPLVVPPLHAAAKLIAPNALVENAGSLDRVTEGFVDRQNVDGAGPPPQATATTLEGLEDLASSVRPVSSAGPVTSPPETPIGHTVGRGTGGTSGVDHSSLPSLVTGTALPADDPIIGRVQHAADPFADVGERMMMAWVRRIEQRHVRLIEVDGRIIAAPDQPLERGDAILMADAQAALRSVKDRQDGLAMEVAKDLWLNAERLIAGRTDATDPLTLSLKVKWARDPAIAWAVARIWGPPPEAVIARSHEAAFRSSRGQGVI